MDDWEKLIGSNHYAESLQMLQQADGIQHQKLMQAQMVNIAPHWLLGDIIFGAPCREQHCNQIFESAEYFPFCSFDCKDWHEQITKLKGE